MYAIGENYTTIVRHYQYWKSPSSWQATQIAPSHDNSSQETPLRMVYKVVLVTSVMLLLLLGTFVLYVGAMGFAASTQTQPDAALPTIAFTHAAQDIAAIDVYIDDKLVIEGLQRTDPTFYTQVDLGNHLVDVVPAGENVVLIKTSELIVEAGHSYHLILDGLQADWSVELRAIDEAVE